MDGLVQHTRNEDEEVACIQRAVNEPVFRKEKAREGSERIKNNFMGASWEAYLSDLYAMVAQRVEQAPQVRLVENAGLTITDQESAELSYTFFGAAPNFLLYSLINRKAHFSVSDLVKIYRTLLRSGLPADQRLTIRQVLYFVKQKIKRKSASGVA